MRQLALTFDDGPHPQLTPELLKVASRTNAKLTFFVLGERAAKHESIIKEMLRRGHEVGNHSWSHQNFRHLDNHQIQHELLKTDEVIKGCGGNPHLLRSPYGEISDAQRRFVESESTANSSRRRI